MVIWFTEYGGFWQRSDLIILDVFSNLNGSMIVAKGNGFRKVRFRFDTRKKLFTVRVVRVELEIGCSEKLWMAHPWKCSRPGWMRL